MSRQEAEIFLIDANVLITPYETYYPFDFAPTYWSFLEREIKSGSIQLLDKVHDEISKGKELRQWIGGVTGFSIIDSRDNLILEKYASILDYLQNCKNNKNEAIYKDSALFEWSKSNVADPWLIATAMARGYILVTLEQPNRSLGTSAAKSAKVPDVCKHFDLPCIDLFAMIRKLGFIFE
ncbi:DNA-binding protein [Synergistales bacterium]|nr:DNA-binding protein [Synergistales bacterium]